MQRSLNPHQRHQNNCKRRKRNARRENRKDSKQKQRQRENSKSFKDKEIKEIKEIKNAEESIVPENKNDNKENIDSDQEFENKMESIENHFWDGYNKQQEIINQAKEENEKNRKINEHNGSLASLYTGTKSKFFVEHAINEVIKTNQTYDNKITVKYNEIATQDINEIAKISANLQDNAKYLLTYDYDEDGYIITMNISDI